MSRESGASIERRLAGWFVASRVLLWLAGVLALTFAAYLPSLGNGFTNWDDDLSGSTIYAANDPNLAALTPLDLR